MIEKKDEQKIVKSITGLLVILLVLITIFNTVQIYSMTNLTNTGAAVSSPSTQDSGQVDMSGIIPTGIPENYGNDFGIQFDDVNPSDQRKADEVIRKLAIVDTQTELQGPELERYINILYHMDGGMSCEYCCGARSIIFENGEMACGCAHSFAMRGVAKHLIVEYGDIYSDREIMEEVAKWKVLFFPGQMTSKAKVMESEGIEMTYSNLGANTYRGIEQGQTSGGMVGGC